MQASSSRGWFIGLGLWLASLAGHHVLVSREQQAQAQRLEQLSRELASLRQALLSRPPVALPAPGERVISAGLPPSPGAGGARLAPEELEAIAHGVAARLQQAGAGAAPTGAARERHEPEPPAPLEPAQQESLARASQHIDRIVSLGRLTAEDVQALRQELGPLGARPEAEQLRRRLIVAINKSQLVPPPGMVDWMP
jgi:hypothetical protein